MPKTFLITGASRGLGLELTRQLAAKGHIVIASARCPEKSPALQALVDGKRVFVVTLDTVNAESVKTAAALVSMIAPHGIDVLINNAGILTTNPSVVKTDPLNSTSIEYRGLFDSHVIGTINVTQAFTPLLRKGSVRQIFNMTSVLGSLQSTFTVLNSAHFQGNFAPYRIAKAGQNMVTRVFSDQLAPEGFIVVSIHPGWVKTDMGTDGADVDTVDSIRGVINVMESVTPKDTGAFYDNDGRIVAW